jgi:hypothetical protein
MNTYKNRGCKSFRSHTYEKGGGGTRHVVAIRRAGGYFLAAKVTRIPVLGRNVIEASGVTL